MKSPNNTPEIFFELGLGEFRIITPEAVYKIKVSRSLVDQFASDKNNTDNKEQTNIEKDTSCSINDISGINNSNAPNFFKEVSQELFNQIGQLSRQLSSSVGELSLQNVSDSDLSETGEKLEHAKGQLSRVIELTEKASMSMLDFSDKIQDNMQELQAELNRLNNLEIIRLDRAQPIEQANEHAKIFEEINAIINDMKIVALTQDNPIKLSAEIDSNQQAINPSLEQAAKPQTESIQKVMFDTDIVFQTLYELCTNESVKDHIKKMREDIQTVFDKNSIESQLSEQAKNVEVDDGFYIFPIALILKVLYAACSLEEYKLILKKMNQTADSIFLDSTLPVEGQVQLIEQPITAENNSQTEQPQINENLQQTNTNLAYNNLERLETLVEKLKTVPSTNSQANPDSLPLEILNKDKEIISQAVRNSQSLISKTLSILISISETLSFQDLSGQIIMKIVNMISDVQVQLLSILVVFDKKFKSHKKDLQEIVAETSPEKIEEQLKGEKIIEKLTSKSQLLGPSTENRLNQNEVNDLLAQLGF